MWFKIFKASLLCVTLIYAAQSLGLSSTYRVDPSITESDFSSDVIFDWQKDAKGLVKRRSGSIVSIEQGRWYWRLMGANTRIVYRDERGMDVSMLVDEGVVSWFGCDQYLWFEFENGILESDIDPSCLSKKQFQDSVSTLIKVVKAKVQIHQDRIWAERRKQDRNLATWS